ncbi:MAG TPA: helix-turn-helix transcriptional regulator, partial [Candidatus Limnocylindrales bacterium]|nr:helix-turn-helix transcriptional regulator [Candidatus Limnocylindrales bacterium]
MSEPLKGTSEIRELTPAEIGDFVRDTRERLGVKRLTLASRADLSEKTIERLEGGQKVGEDAYRRTATALGMDANAFLGPRPILTDDEVARQVARWLEENAVITGTRIRSQADLGQVLAVSMYLIDDRQVGEQHAEASAVFQQNLTDWGDLYNELPATGQLDAR